MSGYYPEGVTGNEYEIAGGYEFTRERGDTCENETCEAFGVEDVEVEVDITRYGYNEYYDWECPTCLKSINVKRSTEEF